MAADNALDLEELAHRYDAQVLREFLLEQGGGQRDAQRSPAIPEQVFEPRIRCLNRLCLLLVFNVFSFWSVMCYCTYSFYLRIAEEGINSWPPIDAVLAGFFLLGTQATLEFACSACLLSQSRPVDEGPGLQTWAGGLGGLKMWDLGGWCTGLGARSALLLDAQCLALMWHASDILFAVSSSVFFFSVVVFVFLVQIRSIIGLFCSGDRFSYDKPDLFFKGRDLYGGMDGTRISALPALGTADELEVTVDRQPHPRVLKCTNLAQLCDLQMLHFVLVRQHIPLRYQETQEFVSSVTAFARCFCEDLVQCSLKFFFLMDFKLNLFVYFSLLVSVCQAIGRCLYASTSSMDLRSDEDGSRDD
eukprot:TRINITY_DN42354_c0_g1_i2.p1 TRINITY_DN42354_c0_g1~~TRINITY_DN42354_c0_g1_i2.p1  ORF type:complete len:360 (+),score=59.52 TRINITY_DN42354_c0_g1_i2:90-1169(+)